LIEFGASIGVLPLDMPESVLVRFSGTMQTGITLRDLVNAIPYVAIKDGFFDVIQIDFNGCGVFGVIISC
jgi:aconitate hydratase 2/2-methylisocitrate dehydratase